MNPLVEVASRQALEFTGTTRAALSLGTDAGFQFVSGIVVHNVIFMGYRLAVCERASRERRTTPTPPALA
jgi:hypothetical protein